MTLLKALDRIDGDGAREAAEANVMQSANSVTEKGFFDDTTEKARPDKRRTFASSAFSGMAFIESGKSESESGSESNSESNSESDAKSVAGDGKSDLPDLSEKKESIIEAFKNGRIARALFTKKNGIIVAAMFALCCLLAGGQYLTTLSDSGARDFAEAGENAAGEIVADAGSSDENSDSDAYFASAEINRNRARDESIDVLSQVIDSEDAMQESKDIALASMAKIASQIEAEANIEALVEAKGFSDCVAIVGDNSATIIVCSDGLLANEVAQITEIVCEQTNLGASGIKIVEKAGV